jgi:hypothetical protein
MEEAVRNAVLITFHVTRAYTQQNVLQVTQILNIKQQNICC